MNVPGPDPIIKAMLRLAFNGISFAGIGGRLIIIRHDENRTAIINYLRGIPKNEADRIGGLSERATDLPIGAIAHMLGQLRPKSRLVVRGVFADEAMKELREIHVLPKQ